MSTATVVARVRRVGLLLLVGALGLSAFGCGGGGEADVAASGDPEADRRAEMRVGSEGEKDNKGGKDAPSTLYERLGGKSGITAIVDDMTTRVVADPRVNFERRDVKTNVLGKKYRPWEASPENIEVFKHHMVEFIALAAGGPAEYTGRDMRTVHKDMKITNNEFDAMVGDIKTSMDRLKVGTAEQRDLLAIIETTREQIVEKE